MELSPADILMAGEGIRELLGGRKKIFGRRKGDQSGEREWVAMRYPQGLPSLEKDNFLYALARNDCYLGCAEGAIPPLEKAQRSPLSLL
ncbi:MAG: hypothetical protein N2170_07425 [Bacteroidia bacterium]|nr:hypothetical protein [Bacteroidia bacterium]